MKNILLLLFLLVAGNITVHSQTQYHHYLDSTSEWHVFMVGGSPSESDITYLNIYLDGDTLIGSNWYYRQRYTRLDSVYTQSVNYGATSSFDSWLIREDSTGKILHYVGGTERLMNDWGHMPSLGDSFANSNCVVALVDSVYLGTMPLRRIRPLDDSGNALWTRGYVEGVGETFLPCAMGYEANDGLSATRDKDIHCRLAIP
jgi:hypothetical protein